MPGSAAETDAAGYRPLLFYDADWRVASVMELDTVPNGDGDGVIQTMHAVVNPDKLGHLGPVSDVARLPGEGSQR